MTEVVEKNIFLEIVKWLGTLCVIVAATSRAFEFYQIDHVLSIFGAGAWAYAAIKMKDKSLFVVNGFIVAILIIGLLK